MGGGGWGDRWGGGEEEESCFAHVRNFRRLLPLLSAYVGEDRDSRGLFLRLYHSQCISKRCLSDFLKCQSVFEEVLVTTEIPESRSLDLVSRRLEVFGGVRGRSTGGGGGRGERRREEERAGRGREGGRTNLARGCSLRSFKAKLRLKTY